MIPRASEWVADYFGARAIDRTPERVPNGVRVLFAPFSQDPGVAQRCAAILSRQELARADRFLDARARSSFLQRRAFRRHCAALAFRSREDLGKVEFRETEKGQPYLPSARGWSFSFSASRIGLLGAWSPGHHVGVDLEDRTKQLEAADLAERFFSSAESRAVRGAQGTARLRIFYRLWCLKEAALKCIGEGLPFGLDAFQFEFMPKAHLASAPRDWGAPANFQSYEIDDARFCGALVLNDGALTGSSHSR